MYEVIGSRASRTMRVLWMLEELGVPYTHVPAAPQSDEVKAINPSGKVPILRGGGAVLTDSVAIMTYLGDRHGKLTHQAGTIERAHQDALTLQILDEMDALLWAAARHTFVLPKEHRVPAIKPALKWEYGRNVARLSRALHGAYLMGERITIPDLLLAHCLIWAEAAKFPAPGARLAEFRARMEARGPFQRAAALP